MDLHTSSEASVELAADLAVLGVGAILGDAGGVRRRDGDRLARGIASPRNAVLAPGAAKKTAAGSRAVKSRAACEHEHGAAALRHDLVAWKSHIGPPSRATACSARRPRSWGRSGAITEAVITRSSAEEGFLIALPQPNVSLFIGVSNLSGSLYDSGRAHQEDLEFSLRVSSDGTLSYSSRARLMQYYYAAHLEADVIGTYEKGDVVGMRLDPQRKGFAIVKQEARSEGGTQLRVLRNFSEVLQFPLKLMVVLGGSPMQVGPVTWLKASGDARAAAAPERSLKGPAVLPDGAAPAAAAAEKVVVATRATCSRSSRRRRGRCSSSGGGGGSWAAGCVRKVPPSAWRRRRPRSLPPQRRRRQQRRR